MGQKISHIVGFNGQTYDLGGGGTDVFAGENHVHSKVKITISGFTTGPFDDKTATIIDQSNVVKINFTDNKGTATEYTDLDTLYNDIISNNYYEFEFVNNSGNDMPSNKVILFNTSTENKIYISNSLPFSGDDAPIGCYCEFKGYGSAPLDVVSISEDHYDKLKIIDPLKVNKVDGVPCLTGPDYPQRCTLSYSGDSWKLRKNYKLVDYSDIHIGDIVEIHSSSNPLPENVCLYSAYLSHRSSNPKEYIKYVSLDMQCVVSNVSAGYIYLQAIPVNYATAYGDSGSYDGSYSSSDIMADSSEDDIAAALRYLKNVVEENAAFTNHYYMLYGYGPNGIIANLNQQIHRIVYDDGSFAAIYYPEAGTIPDGIRPGFTSGAGSTPPVGNWNPRIAYDSMFFYSGNTKCSIGLEYNGKGFYGTPESGSGVYYTNNTKYIIVFGHFTNYMDLSD